MKNITARFILGCIGGTALGAFLSLAVFALEYNPLAAVLAFCVGFGVALGAALLAGSEEDETP